MIAILVVIIVIFMIVISYYITKNEFWIGPKGYFRYYGQFYPNYLSNAIKNSTDKPFYITDIHNKNNNEQIFALSLYGNNPKYFNGAKKIIEETKRVPGWTLRIYCHDKFDSDNIQYLINNTQIETYMVHDDSPSTGNSSGAFWRFMPLSENITFITLDADERNIFPERPEVLDTWLNSDRGFLRLLGCQYPWAKVHIWAKYFGRKKGYGMVSPEQITHFPIRSPYGSDELCLQSLALPLIKKDKIMSFFMGAIQLNKIVFKFCRDNSLFGRYEDMDDQWI